MALLQYRQAMYFRIRDIPDPTSITTRTGARINDTYYNLWINRGIQRIFRETLFNEKTATLTPDGSASSFTLVGSDEANVAAGYFSLQSIDHANNPVEKHPGGINSIRILETSGEIVGGNPYRYAIFGGKIYFDAIPGASLTLNFFYYGVPVTLSTNGAKPEAPLDIADDLIIAAAMLEYADDEGDEGLMRRNEVIYQRELQTFTKLVESKGKHQRSGGAKPHIL